MDEVSSLEAMYTGDKSETDLMPGGAQNIGKAKDKSKDNEATDKGHKTGTFRGLRGIM